MDQKPLTKNILSAAELGLKNDLRKYINNGMVNVVDEEGSTPLMYAAANGREEVVRMLLDEECLVKNKLEYNTATKYINLPNVYGWTALMQAACYGHLNVVVSLIQRGADVNLKNTWGASALVGASQGGFFAVVNRLLNVGADVNPEEGNEGADTLTPLMAATQCGHLDIVGELLRRGANVNTCLKGTRWTALMLAVLNNQLPVMEVLLKHGANKEAEDVNEQTAADLATALGHQDMVLLLTGEKPKECSEGEFFDMVKSGDVDRVSQVLETQKQLANRQDKDGATPLMLAANKGNIKMCEVLLDRGANVNTKDEKYGWTAFMLATHQRKYEVVQLLGERGADVNVRGKSGSTAFDVANMISDIKMIRLVANISVEQIERKGSSVAPPLAVPVLSGEHRAMVNTPPPSEGSSDVGVAKSKVGVVNGDAGDKKNEPVAIDLTDLKHKLDKAYRTQTPSISVKDNKDPFSKDSSSQSRFPTKPHSASSSRQLTKPISSSLSSSTTSETSSTSTPSSGSSNSTMARSGIGDPFRDRSVPISPASSTNRRKPPPTLLLKGNPSSRSPAPKTTPRTSSTPGLIISSNALLGSKFNPGQRRVSAGRSKLKELPLLSPSKSEGGGVRKRADTAPVRSVGGRKKKVSLPRPPSSGPDCTEIKYALEQDSLGHLFPIFQEQEMEMKAFLTLNSRDLRELGVVGTDTDRVLSLISRLKLTSPALTPSSALASPGTVFTFIP